MWPTVHTGVTHRRDLGPNKEIWVLDFFLGSVWMLQLHLCCPLSWLPALSIMSGPLLEGCPTEGKKIISAPLCLLGCVIMKSEYPHPWEWLHRYQTHKTPQPYVLGYWPTCCSFDPVCGGLLQNFCPCPRKGSSPSEPAYPWVTGFLKQGVPLPGAIELPSNKNLCQTPQGEQQFIAFLAKTESGWIPVTCADFWWG